METEDITEFEPFKKYSLKDTPPPLFERVLFIWSDGLFYTGELIGILNDNTLQIYNDKIGSNITHNRGYWMRIVTDLEPRLCTPGERKFLDEAKIKAMQQTSLERGEEYWSTGNYDDTYSIGLEDGYICFCRGLEN